jgi:hypothetical protein
VSEREKFECFIGLLPYPDGSGYRVKLTACIGSEGPKIDLQMVEPVAPADWMLIVMKASMLITLMSKIEPADNGEP